MPLDLPSIEQSRAFAINAARTWPVSLFPPVSFVFAALAGLIALIFMLGDRGARAPAAVALAFTALGYVLAGLGMVLIGHHGAGFDGLLLMCMPGLLACVGWRIAAAMYSRRLAAAAAAA